MAVRKSAFVCSTITGFGTTLLGMVQEFIPAISGSAFQAPAAGVIQDGWMKCEGTLGQRTIASGPLTGAIIPDLSDNRFLQGSTVSWSNANDANPAYKGDKVASLSYTGDATPRAPVFNPGTFVPAGASDTATLGTVVLAHSHPVPHSHATPAPGAGLVTYFQGGPKVTFQTGSVPAAWTANFAYSPAEGSDSVGSGSNPGVTQATVVYGTTDTTVATSSPELTPGTFPHSHTMSGTPVPVSGTFTAPGTFTPTGTVTLDMRPNYVSSIYLLKVA